MTARDDVLLRSRTGARGLFRALGVLLVSCLALVMAFSAPGPSQARDTPATHWVALRGDASDAVVGPQGNAYALDAAGNVWLLAAERVRRGASWMRQPGQFRKLRATLDGRFWGLAGDGDLYRLDGSVWRRVERNVRDVAATPDGI